MAHTAHLSLSQTHDYWRLPPDENNAAERYSKVPPQRSEALVKLFEQYVSKRGRVLEVGCNVGRNLDYLYRAGYRNLAGIDISEVAIQKMGEVFPHVKASAKLCIGPVEDVITEFRSRYYDAVCTMAVLVHIHPDSEWVFAEIAKRSKKYLIVVEDERMVSPRHFRREYKSVFEAHRFRQVAEVKPFPGLPKANYVGRIFKLVPQARWEVFREQLFGR